MFFGDFEKDPDKIRNVTVSRLMETLKGIQDINFSKEEYGGASSAGGLNQLVKDIAKKMSYLGSSDYDKFIKDFKLEYATPFKEWLNNNVKELKKK